MAADLGVVVYEGEFGGFARGAAGEDLLGFGVVSGGVIVVGGLTRIDSCARVFKYY